MKTDSIFQELGFERIKEKDVIISSENLEETIEVFGVLLKEGTISPQVIITQNLENEALAISTAENSELTKEEAHKIEETPEQALRIAKYRDSNLSTEKKYEQLEYENIKIITNQNIGMSFEDLSLDLIKDLHQELTCGLDTYGKPLKISSYHSGHFRKINTVKVGKFPPYTPPESERIERLLSELLKHYQSLSKVTFVDIIEFCFLFYAIHPFQNGNKRVSRVLESALLSFYGFSVERTISLGYAYSVQKSAFHLCLLSSLKHKNTTSFVNFAVRCYLGEGLLAFEHIRELERQKKIKSLLLSLNDKKKQEYSKALEFLKNYIKNKDFANKMQKEGIGYTASQNILKKLVEKKIIFKKTHTEGVFYTHLSKPFFTIKAKLESLLKQGDSLF